MSLVEIALLKAVKTLFAIFAVSSGVRDAGSRAVTATVGSGCSASF